MFLFVGLGNPGPQYAGYRHNIGFMAADALAATHGFGPWRSRFLGLLSEGQLGGEKVLLQKPETFMNRSGQAVAPLVNFYKLPLENVVVMHDEIDLPPGKVRIKTGGGVAGHNGLRSIAASLGSNGFRRVRFGIGHPGHKDLVSGHVLGNFQSEDRTWVAKILDAFVEAAPLLVKGQDAACMNKIALLSQPPARSQGRAGGKAPEN